MARVKDMDNPMFIGKVLTHDQTLYVRKLRRVRNGATKALRSGNPAKRAEAARVLAEVPGMIRKVYIDNGTR